MTSQSSKNTKKIPLNASLIAGLLAVLAIWIAIAVGNTKKTDPTLTAAPAPISYHPVVSPPQSKIDYLNGVQGSQSEASPQK